MQAVFILEIQMQTKKQIQMQVCKCKFNCKLESKLQTANCKLIIDLYGVSHG